MKYKRFLVILFLLSSCGGGGGGGAAPIPFAITIGLTSFFVDEDNDYSGSLSATANEVVTLSYAITSDTTNGSLTLNSSGEITYTPNSNFYGSDQFQYSVNASEKNITRTATVDITVNAVNDAPTIVMDAYSDLNKDNLIFETKPSYNVTYTDIDNDLADLTFSASLDDETIPSVFTSISEGYGSIELDLSSISKSGFLNAKLSVSDGTVSSSSTFDTWFIANKNTVTVSKDDDKSDGFDEGTRTDKDYYVYELIGDTNSTAGTKWLFVADSLADESDITSFRTALL